MGSVGKGLRPLITSKSFGLLHSLTTVIVIDPNVVSNPYHPLHYKVLKRLEVEETHAPRFTINAVATKKKVSKHSVVRNKAVRRVREAAYEALNERGYGKGGELLNVTENETVISKERLMGTLSFWVTMESVVTGWNELKEEVGTAIDKFIALGQKSKNMRRKGGYGRRAGSGVRGRNNVEEGQLGV